MTKKNIKELGEMHHKSIGFFMVLKLDDAVNYIKREYHNYDIVKFTYEGTPYQLEMRFTLTSQKTLL